MIPFLFLTGLLFFCFISCYFSFFSFLLAIFLRFVQRLHTLARIGAFSFVFPLFPFDLAFAQLRVGWQRVLRAVGALLIFAVALHCVLLHALLRFCLA